MPERLLKYNKYIAELEPINRLDGRFKAENSLVARKIDFTFLGIQFLVLKKQLGADNFAFV